MRIQNQEAMLTEGIEYTVGINDGRVFDRIVYKGMKNFGGKHMMCFETEENAQVRINPSYNSFIIEEIEQFPNSEELTKGE